MYGYEPPKEPQGSWREVFEFSWVAFTIVMPIIGLVIGVILLVMLFFICLSIHPLLTLIPAGILVAIGSGFVLLDRRNQARLEAQHRGESPHGQK
jgi:hypothetical protein